MKIAVLGGSFNPFHCGHAMLAETVVKELNYDKVLLVPTYIAPHKVNSDKILPEQKKEMLERFCQNEGSNFCELETCEIDRGGVSYTYDTLCYLYEKYKGCIDGKIGLIMGDEMAAEFHKWYKPDEIAGMADLIITHRQKDFRSLDERDRVTSKNQPSGSYKGDFAVRFDPNFFKYPYKYLELPVLPVSSTDIRDRVKCKKSFRFLLPSSIYDYIVEKGLYSHTKGTE